MTNRVFRIFCLCLLGLAVNKSQWVSTQSNLPLQAADSTFCKLQREHENFMIVKNANNGTEIALGAQVPKDTPLAFACKAGYSLKGSNNTICGASGRWTKELPRCISFCTALQPRSGFSTKAYFELNGIDVSHAEQFELQTIARISCAHGFNKPPNFENTLQCSKNGWSGSKVPCDMECGKPEAMITPFSRKGDDTNITEVPWHVGIYEQKHELYENVCGGVLISPRVVISAAHCFFETDDAEQMADYSKFVVAAGKYYRDFNTEKERNISAIKISGILKVWIPTNYTGKGGFYFGDLAILRLAEFIPFSKAIRPVCLPQNKGISDTLLTDLIGKVSTWNQFSASEPFSVLKTLLMSAVSYEKCNETLSADLQHGLPADKFCLVSYNVEAVACKGDSGSGFVVKMPHTNEFVLLGIVSFSPTKTHDCMHDNLLVVTNILYYQHIIEQFKSEDLENDVAGFDRESYELFKKKEKTCKVPNNTDTDFMIIKGIPTGSSVQPGYEAPVDTFYAITCKSGYVLNGKGAAICRPDGYWLDSFPKCVVQSNVVSTSPDICRIPMEKHNLKVKNAVSGYFIALGSIVPKNTTLLFTCEAGFNLRGANESVCKGGNEWTNGLPFCYSNCSDKQASLGFSTKATFAFESDAYVAKIDCAYFYGRPKDFHEVLTCTENGWNLPKYACYMNCGRPEEPVTAKSKLGVNTNFTDAPWHVDIYEKSKGSYEHICGGTLISPRFVVSAAHCFFQAQRTNATKIDLCKYSIVAGKHSREIEGEDFDATAIQERNIKEIWTPDDYKGAINNYSADISIIKLAQFMTFTFAIRPACLYLAVGAYQNVPSNVQGRIAAWSRMKEAQRGLMRQTLHLETMSYDDCNRNSSEKTLLEFEISNKFCLPTYAPAASACQIDSGTGFVARNPDGGFALFGVVSFMPKGAAVDCNRRDLLPMTNALFYKTRLQETKDQDIKNDVDIGAAMMDDDGELTCSK